MKAFYKQLQLWHKVLIGLIAGIGAGIVLGPTASYLEPIGLFFLRLIKMIVVPLIFFSIINGLGSVKNAKQLGRVGVKAAAAYVLCTAFAICLGMFSAVIFEPGAGLQLVHTSGHVVKSFKPLEELLKIIPDNCIGAMAQGLVLQVVFFSIFCGITIVSMGEKANRIVSAVKELTEFVLAMVRIIVKMAPIAAFCLMAWCVGTQGVSVLLSLSRLVLAGVAAFILQYFIFGGMIKVWGKVSPIPFYKRSFEYQAMAFSTSSTKASLPITMAVCRDKMGISETSTSFILPLGASINMDGLAIYLGLCAITVAQAFGHHLTWSDYGIVMFTATLGSIGGAGIPSAAIVMLPMVLGSINLPSEAAVALIMGIDRLMDTFRTTISITGDAAVTLIVDSSEGMLDKEKYYGKNVQNV